MKSQIIINEIFHSIPKYNAFSFEELIAFAQPNVDPQRLKRKILKDGRFIYIQSEAIEDEYFILDSALFRWFSLLNLRLAQNNIFRLNASQVASKISSLRDKGRWATPPIEIIRWGKKLGLICLSYSKDQYVFPLARIMASTKNGLLRVIVGIFEDLGEEQIWNFHLRKKVKIYINEGFSYYDEKTSFVIREREGLKSGKKKILQEIGDYYKLTRERIRQIEEKYWSSILFGFLRLKPIIKAFLCDFMSESGNLLVDVKSSKLSNRIYLAKCLKIPFIKISDIGLVLIATSPKDFVPLKSSKWFPDELDSNLVAQHIEKNVHTSLSNRDIRLLAKKISQLRFGQLSKQQRIYLALQKIGRPAHYSEITSMHNTLFPIQASTEHNVHAALFYKKFGIVWIGIMGTYALKEWGYDRPSMSLFDTIYEIVKKKHDELGMPIPFSVITAELGRYRKMVKPSSITLATYFNPKLSRSGKDSFTPKLMDEEKIEERGLEELDKIFKDFQEKIKF